MVQISKLRLITTPEDFFSSDKIMFVDVVDVSSAPIFLRIKLEDKFGAFRYEGGLYLPGSLCGSPENLFLKVKKGVPMDLGDGDSITLLFDGKLEEALAQKKIYDYTADYSKNDFVIAKEIEFLAERYILPYRKK
ncbi:MAG: hypothetical protein J0I09_08080 [Sphingobacteriia bacterium]|nr:hypothetical protein [Sphingobacteriia bacterium]